MSMQCVILAAGRGSRMGVLTEELPKPLLEVAGKTLLEHTLDVLPKEVEVVMVIGYLGEMIRARFGSIYDGKNVNYVEQKNPIGGTADSLWQARDLLEGDFMVVHADDIHSIDDVRSCMDKKGWAMCVKHVDVLGNAADVQIDETGRITDIVEASSHGGGPGIANTGLYIMNKRVFEVDPVLITGRTELGLPQTMLKASRAFDIPIATVEATRWISITSPDDLAIAEAILG